MSHNSSPITISKIEARRFMLAHHGLYPPRQRQGKAGAFDYIRQVNCIQFDPINIVGRNPDLVLQSRVKDYRPALLDELLYQERQLLDGWDKMASIYPVEDWPYFLRHKNHLQSSLDSRRPPQTAVAEVLAEIGRRGPLSSLDFEATEKVDWYWGPTKIVRACLEHLFAEGTLGIDHRINSRRAFDQIERLLPQELLAQSDPHASTDAYHDWHIHRRVGSLGLAHSKSGEYWLGILGAKSQERSAALKRLTQRGDLIPIQILEIEGQVFYLRRKDLPTLESILRNGQPEPGAAFLAPLDNLIWNRGLIQAIFNFDYTWEVYKPRAKRKYGYYVLPVLYGDRFIARFDPVFDKKERILTLQNWWWEESVKPDQAMLSALAACLHDFLTYLEADHARLGKSIENEQHLQWVIEHLDRF